MKIILSLFVLVAAFTFSLGQDDACKNDFQQFLTCAKSQFTDTEKQSMKADAKSKSDTCFQNAGCAVPDTSSGKKQGMGQMMQMSDAVKQCLKRKILEKVGAKLNECLQRKGVGSVNISQIADSLEGAGVGASAHGDGGSEGGLQGAMQGKMAVVKGVDKCCVDKYGSDTNKVKPLEQCLHDVKTSLKPRICNDLKPCDSKVSPNCFKRGQQLRKALCECKQEKEKEIAGKLAELGKQPKVSVQDLMHTIASDQDLSSVGNDIDACYSENGEQEPPMMKLAILMMAGGGGAKFGAAMTVEGRQVTIASDMLYIDANDPSECAPCQ